MGSNIAQYARKPTARGFISRDVRARALDVARQVATRDVGSDRARARRSPFRRAKLRTTRDITRPRSNAIERDRTKDARGDDADADAAGDAHGCG